MRPDLHTMILDYQQRVAIGCQMLREQFQFEKLYPWSWNHAKKPRRGWLDEAETVSYSFHGIGCRLEFGNIVVDFDFGPDCRYDGFDAWRLWIFAESVPAYHSLADLDKLRDELEGLKQGGELVKFPDSSLYYFHNDTPITKTAEKL